MFTKDNDINIKILFGFKIMSCEKGKFLYCFFIFLLNDMNFLPQNSYFYHPSSFEHEIIFKESLVTYYDEPGCVGRFSEETQMYPGPL